MPRQLMIGLKPDADPEPMLELATSVADVGASLHLVSLVAVGTQDNERQRLDQLRARLEASASSLTERGYRVEVYAQVNAVSPGAQLARLATEQQADLLVIGLGKRSRVGKALLGSDAQTAILTSPCPVLCARAE